MIDETLDYVVLDAIHYSFTNHDKIGLIICPNKFIKTMIFESVENALQQLEYGKYISRIIKHELVIIFKNGCKIRFISNEMDMHGLSGNKAWLIDHEKLIEEVWVSIYPTLSASGAEIIKL